MKKEKPVPLQELTMRDFFAAFAMMGFISTHPEPGGDVDMKFEPWAIAGDAYDVADGMMEERKK